MFKKCGKIMEKHVGQSSALQEIDRWSSCKFSTAGKHSVVSDEEDLCSFINVPDVLIDKTVEVFLKSKAKLILEKKSLHSNYIFRIQI